MIDQKILLQALGRAWFIEPSQAQHYASVIENLFARDGKNIWQDMAVQPVSADFVFCVHPSANQQSPLSDAPAGSVAVISLSGAVMKYDFCGAPGTQSIMGMIDQVNQNPNIDAIVLKIDSPGGAVDGTQALANKIKNSQKPVVAFVDGMMASAAMWFGSAAAYRIASSSTDMIGSIGTMASWRDSSQLQKAAGIRIHEVYATASTHKNNEFRAANADEPDYQPMIDNILDPTNEQFMAAVKSNIKNVNEEVFTGAIYLADKAKEMGLINQIGTMDDAVNKALQLATKKSKNIMEQNQRFANVLAASGAESFDMLNEGIWLTEAQLEGIELALSQSVAAVESAQLTVNTVEGGLTEMQSTLETTQTQLQAANDRIIELEAAIIPPADATTHGDPDKSVKGFDKYPTSYDAEAKKLNALIEK
jgi:signal peptide peptidase SppA